MARSHQRPAASARGRVAPLPVADTRSRLSRADRFIRWLSRHWLATVLVILGVYIGLPWLAPIFMQSGWTGAARSIYTAYATQCHQLPQRSFFLFGPQPMYSLADIQRVFRATDDPLILRQFIGNAELGWKVAWSDRMVAMYGSMFLFGLLYALVRKRVRPIRLLTLIALLLPLALDGVTHMLSDIGGIGSGFRDTNAWLATLTGHALPATFYAGDALGSFNSWMRLLTGVLFGVAVIGFGFPHLERVFRAVTGEFAAAQSYAHQPLQQSARKRI